MTLVKFKKLGLYFNIAMALLLNTKKPWRLLYPLFGKPALIELSNGIKSQISTPVEALILAETALFDCYNIRQLKDPKLVVDVGGAFGDFVMFTKAVFPNCKVLSFEPVASSFRKIENHVKLNDLKNVEVYNSAVGTPGTGTLYGSAEYGPTGSSIKPISEGVVSEQITIVGLDSYLHGEEVDLLKIDCEGAELDVLKSISPEQVKKIKRIALEYHELYVPGQVAGLTQFLRENGFQFKQIEDEFIPGLGYLFASR